MRNIFFSIGRHKHHFTFLIALSVSIVILLTNTSTEILYVRGKLNTFFSFVATPFTYIRYLMYVDQENVLLREKNLQFALQIESMLDLKDENAQLKKLLKYKDDTLLDIVASRVISVGVLSGVQSATINIGSEDGVTINDPVLTPEGVVGKVIIVNDKFSIVQLISDINFRLSVRVLPEGATGILRFIAGQTCEIREIPKNSQVGIGNRVVTSGFSETFPAGLPVGEVTGLYNERGSYQKIVTIQLHDELSSLRHVFVIRGAMSDEVY